MHRPPVVALLFVTLCAPGCGATVSGATVSGTTSTASATNATAPRSLCLVLANPSFDEPVLAEDEGSTRDLVGWHVLEGNVDVLRSAGPYGVGADGPQYIDLDGTQLGAIQQSADTQIGEHYAIELDLSANGGALDVEISAGAPGETPHTVATLTGHGAQLAPGRRSAADWTVARFEFTATSARTELTFRSRSPDPLRGPLLDGLRCPD